MSMKKGNLDHIICRNLIKYTWKIKEKIKHQKVGIAIIFLNYRVICSMIYDRVNRRLILGIKKI